MTTTLIIPGLKSSGPAHWQSWFEQQVSGTVRVVQRNWNEANLPVWSSRIRSAIAQTQGPLFIVAHSFGALAAVQAANDHSGRISGAMLVAPAEPETFGVGEFLPQTRLQFPSVVVASTNDPWMSVESASRWAEQWGAKLVNLGAAGHINAESGYGPWPEGLAIFRRLGEAAAAQSLSDPRSANLSSRPSRRRVSRTGSAARTLSRAIFTDDRRAVHRAAELLEEFGWTVAPPSACARVAMP